MADSRLSYFTTRKSEKIDTYGEHKVPDPYDWLEDPDSEETKEWVLKQTSLTKSYFDRLTTREKVKERMTQLYDYPKFGCPHKEGKRYFFSKNDGLQNQSVIYVQDTLKSEPKVFFDPNKLSDDGTASLGASAYSESGEFWAYGIRQSGSDWNTYHIKTVDPAHPVADKVGEKLEWIKFSGISWTHDDKGFFYSRYPEQDQKSTDKGTETTGLENHRIYYHFIGTPQSEDSLIFAIPEEPKWNLGGQVSTDGKYLIITVSKDCDPVNLLYIASLEGFNPKKGDELITVNKLINEYEAEYEYLANEGTKFYFKTNLNSPLYKIICIDISHPNKDDWVEIVPQHEKDVISYALCVNNDKLLICWLRDVVDVLELYKITDGTHLRSIELPTMGTVTSISGEKKYDEIFYSHTSFLSPSTIFHFKFHDDGINGDNVVFREPTFEGFDASKFTTTQVFYSSKDGTRIPMFIVHKKDIQKDGKNPVYLYGYGGFNIPLQPYFSALRLTWLSHFQGIFCMANLRGGGEYGLTWHQAGQKGKKQNTFDDFHAAAEYLIKEGYSSPEKISIHGGSNGGLLVSACCNQRPDLYKCGVPAVPVADMLKYHKFTIGHFWISDYGSSDNPEEFDFLYKYSPVHNVKKQPYPAMLITTGDHDDRVSPLHSYKFIAALQNEVAVEEFQKNPLLIRIELKAGHGAGKPTTKIIEEQADVYAFCADQLGAQWVD